MRGSKSDEGTGLRGAGHELCGRVGGGLSARGRQRAVEGIWRQCRLLARPEVVGVEMAERNSQP